MTLVKNAARMIGNLARVGDVRDIAALAALAFRRSFHRKMSRIPVCHDIAQLPKVLSFDVPQDPLVSIIIPTFNQWQTTMSCLSSLAKCAGQIPFEVILADDASTDETRLCEQFVKGIKVIRNSENLGFLQTCNKGAREASGTYLLLLNNDTNVQVGWLNSLLELLEHDQAIGLVGPKLVYPDGRLQEAGGIVWNDGSAWNYGKGDDPDRQQYNFTRETDYISGACIMLPKGLWDEIGGFDERYVPAYCEDVDLAFEVRSRGYKVVYQPESVVVHFEGTSCGTDTGAGIKRYQVINREKFLEKWQILLTSAHFLPGQLRLAVKDRYK